MSRRYRQLLFWVLSFSLLLSGCAVNTAFKPADLANLPQDPRAYLNPASADVPVLSEAQQSDLAQNYRELYFKPWHSQAPLAETEHPFWAIDWLQTARPFDINLKPVSALRKQQLIEQADQRHYPSMSRPAITVNKSSLRALPTLSPLFNDPQAASEGFPFDMLQHSSIAINTPILVSHRSLKGDWYFAETVAFSGWIPTEDIAWVDAELIARIEELPLISVVHDRCSLYDAQTRYLGIVDTGTQLPLLTSTENVYSLALAVAGQERHAVLVEAVLGKADAVRFPLQATQRHMAELAAPLLGAPYDWGGRYGYRDCSAMTRDLMAPFGIWLPRNSSQQAKIGRITELQEFSPVEREKLILAEGQPFFSLLTMPGHIMLYIGERQGQAIVLHTAWGLAAKVLFGETQRWLIGATVITTLQPGQEQRKPFLKIKNLRAVTEKMVFPTEIDNQNSAWIPDSSSGRYCIPSYIQIL